MNRIILMIFLVFVIGGCRYVDIETIPLDSAEGYADNIVGGSDAHSIIVYRSSLDTGYIFREIGMIVMSGEDPEYKNIIDEFRKEAARQGGDGVINFRIKIKKKGEWVEDSSADDEDSGTKTKYEIKTKYRATGTLIKRRKN